MGDPSLLVTRPTATDPTLAPAGRDLLYVLAPAPNTDVGTLDWDAAGSGYVEQMLSAVRSRMPARRSPGWGMPRCCSRWRARTF